MEVTKVSETRQFVVFKLDREEYGTDISWVTEIIEMLPVARVPKTPSYIRGVINLRGEIIPIMDLRRRFGLLDTDYTENTRIVIIKSEDVKVGLIVDIVIGVLDLTEDSIENVANFSSELDMEFIFGVGKVGDKIVTLLNLEKLVKLPGKE